MPQDNVLSLNAFGEIIDPRGKREYPGSSKSTQVSPVDIPLTRVTPQEKPEIIPDESPTKGENITAGRNRRGSEQANQVAAKVLMHITQTKLLHWETKSRAEHEGLDVLFDDLVKIGDKLVESVMGKYGRPELTPEDATFTLSNYENPDSPDGLPRFIDNIDNCFRNECASLFSPEKDPEIHNIIQEILGVIDNASYLLTLQK